jgi:hypothetical protein
MVRRGNGRYDVSDVAVEKKKRGGFDRFLGFI